MSDDQSLRKRPSYNVRIAPPKTRFGWLGAFFYRLQKNKELHIARLYGLGGVAGLVAVFVGLKKMIDYDKEHNRREISIEELLDAGTTKYDNGGEADDSTRPDYVVRGEREGSPEVRISEKDDCVEAAFNLPFVGLKTTTKISMEACQFDDEGNIVLDDRGFPLLKGQKDFQHRWRDRYNYLKSKFESLALFR